MVQNRESDKIRGQMAVLERRVQVSIDLNSYKYIIVVSSLQQFYEIAIINNRYL